MKQLILIFLITNFFVAHGQNDDRTWSIGGRLGDPTGITIKKYMAGHALELSAGQTHLFHSYLGMNDQFDNWWKKQHNNYDYFEYRGFHVSTSVGVQCHYLFRYPIDKIGKARLSGVEWYWGVGAQLKTQTYFYDYRYRNANELEWHYVNDKPALNIDLGADAVLGLEYTFEKVPISVFADVLIFIEGFDSPFSIEIQEGIGGRYNF